MYERSSAVRLRAQSFMGSTHKRVALLGVTKHNRIIVVLREPRFTGPRFRAAPMAGVCYGTNLAPALDEQQAWREVLNRLSLPRGAEQLHGCV
jgi:hypothetical protein